MITKLASVAAVTLMLAMPAAAQEFTLRIDADKLATPEGRATVLSRIARAARNACATTGTRLRDAKCEAEFTLGAINSIKRPEIQAQLRQDYLGAAGPDVAVVAAPDD
ncbi:MAG: UrcA family protein [Alphaproteobacteria bacterium]